MNWRDHISFNPSILLGKATITGTRIPVDLLLEKMGYGYTMVVPKIRTGSVID